METSINDFRDLNHPGMITYRMQPLCIYSQKGKCSFVTFFHTQRQWSLVQFEARGTLGKARDDIMYYALTYATQTSIHQSEVRWNLLFPNLSGAGATEAAEAEEEVRVWAFGDVVAKGARVR